MYKSNSFIGHIPVDGKSLIAAIHAAGISLVLHSDSHLTSGVPTARIFEATAANTVIISDRHPFVVEHFGDNILYIDIEQDANAIYKQIAAHMQWILAHPAKAQAMAAACNKIYKEQFSLEQQLLRVVQAHTQWHNGDRSKQD